MKSLTITFVLTIVTLLATGNVFAGNCTGDQINQMIRDGFTKSEVMQFCRTKSHQVSPKYDSQKMHALAKRAFNDRHEYKRQMNGCYQNNFLHDCQQFLYTTRVILKLIPPCQRNPEGLLSTNMDEMGKGLTGCFKHNSINACKQVTSLLSRGFSKTPTC